MGGDWGAATTPNECQQCHASTILVGAFHRDVEKQRKISKVKDNSTHTIRTTQHGKRTHHMGADW
jgi:hypothetical protein